MKNVLCRAATAVFVFCFVLASPLRADTDLAALSPDQLKQISLEDLLNIPVTSISRRPELLGRTAAAIQVITSDDIRRSGAMTVAEALRLASNLQVAQVDSRQWAISARGFNGTTANKLLVMIDGRSVYTPLFSGIFWDAQDTFLPDIDRIEVVSGPGATLWGANAVNGVINIVTKSARETQGLFLEGGGGTEERGFGGVRYGGMLTSNLSYRVYGKYFDRDSTEFANGSDGADAWRGGQGGFRLDWEKSINTLTFQGDAYAASSDQLLNKDIYFGGGNLLGRWSHRFSESSELVVQSYWDRTRRRIPGTFGEDLDTYDLDLQQRFDWGDRQTVVFGGGFRHTEDRVFNTAALAFLPERLNQDLFSAFVQDEIILRPDSLFLTLGTKVEHTDYTGLEFQPSGRLLWAMDAKNSIWTAISRAVRTPSRIDRDFFVPGAPPFFLAGGSGFDSETVIAYELGYRTLPHPKLSLSVNGFFNQYDKLRSVEPGPGGTLVIANGLTGETLGTELEASYQATHWWRWHAGYTYLLKNLSTRPGRTDLNQARGEGFDPVHYFTLRSSVDLPGNLEFDTFFRYVDRLQTITSGVAGTVPGYAEMDMRLGWRVSKKIEISIVGKNLLSPEHPEFGAPSPFRHEIERSVLGKVTWQF